MYRARKTSPQTIRKMLYHFSNPNTVLGLKKTLAISDDTEDVKALLQALRVVGVLKDVKGMKRSLTCVADPVHMRQLAALLSEMAGEAEETTKHGT